MNIILHPDKTLLTIQQEFTTFFPFLKLEFFHAEYKTNVGYSNKKKLDLSLSLVEVNLLIEPCTFEFDNSMKVSSFEKSFFELTHIVVQIFRKTTSAWIQTIASDDWSLAEQQKEAAILLSEIDKDEPIDYHEQK